MAGGAHIFLRILMITAEAIIFTLAGVLLRPYLPPTRHKISYLLLKLSYLIYLLTLMAFLFFLAFYPYSLEEYFSNLLFFSLLFSMIFPSGVMLARKKVRKRRTLYNYFFTIIHLLIAASYILIYTDIRAVYG